MWTNPRPSWLMLVRVRLAGRRGFTLPLPLAVLDETLEALADLFWLGEALIPDWRASPGRYAAKSGEHGFPAGFSPYAVLEMCRSIFGEMRRYGRWQMVEVDDGKHVHRRRILLERGIKMRKLATRCVINALVFYLAATLFPSIRLASPLAALLAGTVLGVVNLLVRPVLILLTLPVNLLTLGLFTLIVNTWMVMLADRFSGGLRIPGFWLAFLTGLLVSFFNMAFHNSYSRHD